LFENNDLWLRLLLFLSICDGAESHSIAKIGYFVFIQALRDGGNNNNKAYPISLLNGQKIGGEEEGALRYRKVRY
jgi:hypothetical protein